MFFNPPNAIYGSSNASVVIGASGQITVTPASGQVFAVGVNGALNPAFKVTNTSGSDATGVNFTANGAGSGVAVAVISSGNNENATYDAKGSGTFGININATGLTTIGHGLAVIHNASTMTLANGEGNAVLTLKGGGTNDNNMQLILSGTKNGDLWRLGQDITTGNGSKNFQIVNIGRNSADLTIADGTGTVTPKASTTGGAGFALLSGTAPTSPVSGDFWYNGTNLFFRDGVTTRTITWT